MLRATMVEPAWRALSSKAQALYPWLKLEWKGPQNNNNGSIRLSVRQAATLLGIGRDGAAAAFHDLQAKGFIVVTELSALGSEGSAKGSSFEITELPLPTRIEGRKLYRSWKRSADFPVAKAHANNPAGRNRRQDVAAGSAVQKIIDISAGKRSVQ